MADLDDLTDDKRATIVIALRQTIDGDRYTYAAHRLPIRRYNGDWSGVAPGFGFDVPEIAHLSRQAADLVGVGHLSLPLPSLRFASSASTTYAPVTRAFGTKWHVEQ